MRASSIARFLSKVDATGPEHPTLGSPCWVWTGGKLAGSGYGQFGYRRGLTVRAHRLAYRMIVGPIPTGLVLDHLCRVRHCVNPAHLEAVTCGVNIRRGLTGKVNHHKGRATHCAAGHEYTDDNTYTTPSGWRLCRACRRAHKAELKRRHSA